MMPLTRRFKTFIIIAFVMVIVIATLLTLLYLFTRTSCEKDELFFEETNKCYKRGQQGPCSETMIFLEYNTISIYGRCNCPYVEHKRALLYHRDTNHCYFVFSQAFCESGFWLNVTRNGEPICEENRCISEFANSNEPIKDEIVPLKGGRCAILHHPAEGCDKNEVVRFHKDYILPSCKNKRRTIGAHSTCPLGSHLSIVGFCQPDFEFDF